jgi:hypothetical protein
MAADPIPSSTTGPARWLLPSLAQWWWLMLLLILLSQPWRVAMVSSDGDTFMHWRTGEYMLETGHVIRADPFSHTRLNYPIHSKEWLAEILFALAGRVAGIYGLAVVGALVIATTFWLLFRQLLREENDLLVAGLVAMLAAWASCIHWLARPHVFSLLLMVMWNGELRRFERTGAAGRLAGMLAGLTVLWVNLHGGYLAGVLVLGAYWLGALVERDYRKLKVLTGAGLLAGIASLANPSGYYIHVHNFRFLRSEFFVGYLHEYASPAFHEAGATGFLVWLALIFVTLTWRRPKLTASENVLLISWTYFALYASRNIPLLALLSAPILAPALSAGMPVGWRELAVRLRAMNDAGRGWPVVLAAGAAAVVLLRGPTELAEKRWPVQAVRFIQQHPEKFHGNTLNQYMWGGWLMWVLPEHKVFVDGRADFYGEELVKEFQAATALRPDWRAILDKYDVRWTLMPTEHRLNQALAVLTNQWDRAYSDPTATIYVKRE